MSAKGAPAGSGGHRRASDTVKSRDLLNSEVRTGLDMMAIVEERQEQKCALD